MVALVERVLMGEGTEVIVAEEKGRKEMMMVELTFQRTLTS